MKRIMTAALVAFALTTLATTGAQAQSIGFKLGASMSDMDVDPDGGLETDLLTSFGGGGFIRFGMAGLSLQLEALALTKGFKTTDEEFDGEAKFKLDYIEVPVTAMFALGNGPYVFVGPSFGFEVGCKVDVAVGGVDAGGDCDEADFDESTRKKFDVGVTGGVGLQFPMGPGSLLVEGRYTHGLTNLNDDSTDDTKVPPGCPRSWGARS
jgi:hypothetical protein